MVFTSTLTNIVIGVTEMIASGKFTVPKDTKRQVASFLMYCFGALATGYAIFFSLPFYIVIPLAAAVLALLSELQHRSWTIFSEEAAFLNKKRRKNFCILGRACVSAASPRCE